MEIVRGLTWYHTWGTPMKKFYFCTNLRSSAQQHPPRYRVVVSIHATQSHRDIKVSFVSGDLFKCALQTQKLTALPTGGHAYEENHGKGLTMCG